MDIYQLKPTIVVKIKDKIYKIFSDSDSCKEEFMRLNKINEPLISHSSTHDYKMSVVKAISIFKNVLIMEYANGVPLIKAPYLLKSVSIIGEYLAKFHLKNYQIDEVCGPRLLGDFVIDHIYINTDDKAITIIDPGGNYMVVGDQLEDIARFLFSVSDAFRYKPIISIKIMKAFIKGYLINKEIDLNDLEKAINNRKKVSMQKYSLQKSYFKALIGHRLISYSRFIIRIALKC